MKRRNAGPVRLVNFSPGSAPVNFLDQYAARNMLETRQEALRVLIRDRVNQDQATPY